MFDLFSDIFTLRENVLQRLDPRMKFMAAGCFLITLVLYRGFLYPVLVLCASLLCLLAIRVPFRFLVMRLLMPAAVVTVLLVLKLFLTPGRPLVSLNLWGLTLAATREGLTAGFIVGCRVMSAVTVLILFSSVTPAHAIFRAMRWMKVPRDWVGVALLMYRYIFVFLDAAANMATAQRLRLCYKGVGNSFRSVSVLCGAVVLRSIDQAVKTGEAMLLRGQVGHLPISDLPPFSRRDGMASAAACLSILFIFGVCQWFLP